MTNEEAIGVVFVYIIFIKYILIYRSLVYIDELSFIITNVRLFATSSQLKYELVTLKNCGSK